MFLFSDYIHGAPHAQEEREGLIKENSDLEESLKKLRAKSQTDEDSKIKAQMAEINSLNKERQKMKELLEDSSDQVWIFFHMSLFCFSLFLYEPRLYWHYSFT